MHQAFPSTMDIPSDTHFVRLQHGGTNNTHEIRTITYPVTYSRPIAPSLPGPDTAPDRPILLKFGHMIRCLILRKFIKLQAVHEL